MREVQDITHHKGIPTTTPARTLIDLAATFEYRALRRAVREAQRHLVTIPQILATLDRLGPRPGIANLTKILATGHAPTRSELEDAVLDLILNAGFQRPAVNQPIYDRRTQAHPRLPLARPAARHRGRRRRMARQPPSPAKTTPKNKPSSKPAASSVLRVTLGPGDRPSRPDPAPASAPPEHRPRINVR